MADVRYRRNIAGEHYVLRSPFGPVARDIRRRTMRVNVAARLLAPVGPSVPADRWSSGHQGGQLKRSIRSEIVVTAFGVVGRVGSDLDYAASVHEGSRGGYPIRPRRQGGWLRWRTPPEYSDQVFRRAVVHPGNRKGRPFLVQALREAQF